jgi:hypothetical protein
MGIIMGNKTLLTLLTVAAFSVNAQTDDPNNNHSNANPNPIALAGGLGSVLSTFAVPATGGGTAVGMENNGSGNLLVSDIANDVYFTIDTVGALISGPVDISANGNPIGITINATNIFTTDTIGIQVNIFDLSGAFVSSFDVSGQSTFPEGITVAPYNGNLFVVDGSGGDQVAEYDTAGALQNTFPISGTSPDGIAFDSQRCVFWIYDSGSDTVRSYDSAFTEMDNFPGTIAAGSAGGEGVGLIGNSLFVLSTGAQEIVEFDIAGATVAANAGTLCNAGPAVPAVPVPFLNKQSVLLLIFMTILSSLFFFRKSKIS